LSKSFLLYNFEDTGFDILAEEKSCESHIIEIKVINFIRISGLGHLLRIFLV